MKQDRMRSQGNRYIKCAYHPESNAVGICINCNMPVCSTCHIQKGKNTYCQPCFEKLSPGEKPRSRNLTLAGVLGISSGAAGLITGITHPILYYNSLKNEFWFLRTHGYVLALLVIPGLMAIIGARYFLEKEHFWIAIIGGIFAALCFPPLGIPALIMKATSRKEFVD